MSPARIVTVAALCLFASLAHAADRVALVIGNNQYPSSPLRNSVNDARDLRDALMDLGFYVIVRENASRKDMIQSIRDFGLALEGASTALFFYSGHAMQFRDRNYLIPIDAAMGSEEDVTFFSVDVSQVFDRMEKAKTKFNFIILDACRDNPFATSFKVSSVGLAQMTSLPTGTLVAYATAPGSVAQDGFGRNGIYTKHILQNIRVPDVPVEIMFKRVREGVERETLKRQTPWDSSSLKGDFAFNATASRPGTAVAAASGPSADMTLTIEREFWVSVRDSNRAEDIQAYLDKYPGGQFASLAKNRLEGLGRSARVASPPADKPPPSTVATAPGGAPPATPTNLAMRGGETHQAKEPAAEKPIVVAAAPAAAPAPASATAPAAPSQQPTIAMAVPSAPPKPKEQTLGREIAPGIREVTFSDGSIYRGAVRANVLHGKGEYVSKSFKYEGDFNEGLKHGQGIYVWESGDRYEGKFSDDRPDGSGKYVFANGDAYEGEVKAGVIVGRGTYLAKNGDVFEGSFTNGKPNGVGIYRFSAGDRYEGEMMQGKLQGRGRYYSKNGDRIEAPFIDGKPQGKGVYHFSNGDRYEGDIQAGALTGQGVYFYGSGLKYEGEVKLGQPEGKGVFWFLDGTRFEGTFENGLARAKGEQIRPDGTKAPAEMNDGNVRLLN